MKPRRPSVKDSLQKAPRKGTKAKKAERAAKKAARHKVAKERKLQAREDTNQTAHRVIEEILKRSEAREPQSED